MDEGRPPSPGDGYNLEQEETEDEKHFQSLWDDCGVETAIKITWPGTSFPLHISTTLEEDDLAPLFHGTQWAGTRVWRAAMVAIHYVHDNILTDDTVDEGKCHRLLELGCGLGVPGMVLHQLVPELEVLLTDMGTLVTQLKQNLKVNFADDSTIQAEGLSWSKEGLEELTAVTQSKSSNWDITLNCDCVYEPLYGEESWKALADTLSELARSNPECIHVTSVERRNADAVEKFLARLEASPYISSIKRVLVDAEDKHHPIEVYVARGVDQQKAQG